MDNDQIEIDVDAPISVALDSRKSRKLKQYSKRKKLQQTKPERNVQVSNSVVALNDAGEPCGDIGEERLQHRGDEDISYVPEDSIPIPLEEEEEATEGPRGIIASLFDHSVEKHLEFLRTLFKQWGEHDSPPDFNQAEIQHLSSIIFLKEWRDFNYKPKTIKFACQNESMDSKNVIGEISLSQFSSAAVPEDLHNEKSISSQPSKDFVLYPGGLVWALDWCPRANKQLQFLAVAAHPPGSSYNKIGSVLNGRGVIQIWCISAVASEEEGNSSQDQKKLKRCYKKRQPDNSNSAVPKRPRGRPRKHRTNDTSDNIKSDGHIVDPPETQCPKDSSSSVPIEIALNDTYESHSHRKSEDVPAPDQKRQKCVDQKGQTEGPNSPLATEARGTQRRKARNEDPDHVPLPRMVLCLAHNGKVVWDLKWRPSDSHDKLRLGYLAVVLGSGSIEVWEVPCPYAVQAIYNSSSELECTDPRFIKLQPVFRCSKLNCGDNPSIPLTVAWSTSSPHDMIVAGCHDGLVALWKFSAEVSGKETKPLLCFSADTGPIRTLAWAPAESNCEASNVIVTSGNKGLKFWDIRDPFRPLWDFNPVQRNILSLDWLSDPRCVVVSFDDGTLRVLSLMKAANDVPATGKPFTGTLQQGFTSYFCSSFAIWDVHVSRKTGMVAYCGVDGNTLRFQLTIRAVERDPSRNREPHFLCGSLTEEESELSVVTPQHDIPFPMKKSLNEWSDAPRTKRGFLSASNQKKREKEEMEKNKLSDGPPLALCYGNDPWCKLDVDPSVSPKTKNSATKRTSKADERGLTCINENPERSQNAVEQKRVIDEIDRFPPKSIAIYRVRWNMNEGSTRWLCYGGAAGIIRVQKVS